MMYETDGVLPDTKLPGGLGRLQRHGLRPDPPRDRGQTKSLHPKMAAQMPRSRRQPGRGRPPIFYFPALPAEPMEVDPNHERHRTPARGIQAADQDADRPAER